MVGHSRIRTDTSTANLSCAQGLWGPGSAFADFQAFLDSMKRRGVSFLEMLAMEMKSEGYYVARGLSFKCALRLPFPTAGVLHLPHTSAHPLTGKAAVRGSVLESAVRFHLTCNPYLSLYRRGC